MQTKLIAFIFAIVILGSSCSTTKKVKLTPSADRSKELRFLGFTAHYTLTSSANHEQADYAKSIDLKSFFVTKFDYDLMKYWNLRLKSKTISPSNYEGVVEKYKLNNVMPHDSLDTELIFLVGQKNNGSYVVVADQNNNKSFRDDSIYVFADLPKGHSISYRRLDTLPYVRINNLNAYVNGELKAADKYFILQPALGNSLEESYNLPQSSWMELCLVSIGHFTGQYKYKGNKYKVLVRNGLEAFIDSNQRSLVVKFMANKNDYDFQKQWNQLYEYKEGDTLFELDNHQFVIKKISPRLNYITIQRLKVPKA